jgi:hypothetical protein
MPTVTGRGVGNMREYQVGLSGPEVDRAAIGEPEPPGSMTLHLRPHGWFGGRDVDLEREPAPTVLSGGFGSYGYQLTGAGEPADAARVVYDGRHPGEVPRDITDGQAPTVLGPGNNSVMKVVYDERREGRSPRDVTDEPAPTVRGGRVEKVTQTGPAPTDLPPSYQREWRNRRIADAPNLVFNLRRDDPDGPSSTVVAAGGISAGVTHPEECRRFTIAELKRICAFPDDYVLTGTYVQQWERCGQSVPPVMMSHIAAAIRDRVLAVADGR